MELPLKAPYRNGLEGARILVGDDEVLIALDIAAILTDAGATIIGPCTNLAHLLKLARQEHLSAAVLDIQLGRATTQPVAEALSERQIPFLFYSGQALPEKMRLRWPKCVLVSKPAAEAELITAIIGLLTRSRR
jgi:DNA-binding response OmpR family regulator